MRRALIHALVVLPFCAVYGDYVVPGLDNLIPKAQLVVVGTLGKPLSGDKGGERSAEIEVQEVLFGRIPNGPLTTTWRHSEDLLKLCCPEGGLAQAYERAQGKPMLWVLEEGAKGEWGATNEHAIVPLEKRGEVEKLLQARLAADLKVLQEARALHLIEKDGPPSAEWTACSRLAQAGPAGVPVALDLLKSEHPAPRLWGCRLAAQLKEPALAGALKGFLRDDTEVEIATCTGITRKTMSKFAEEALAGCSAGQKRKRE